MINFTVICLFIFAGLIMLAPVALIIFGIKKNKRKVVLVTSLVTLSVVFLTALYRILFPTNFPYVDLWIYGKTAEQISNVYGEPDFINANNTKSNIIGYKLGKDNGFFGIMASSCYYYYYIYFDENETAYRIEKRIQIGG
ncbi:MAG: hypothetical protein NC228_06750 [[Eubacterium] siraeum]|nr:hypothetical protein [[Eubacterium] siraeum]